MENTKKILNVGELMEQLAKFHQKLPVFMSCEGTLTGIKGMQEEDGVSGIDYNGSKPFLMFLED